MRDFRNLPPGSTLGPYTLQERLGRGAFATVYAARGPTGTACALKVRRTGEDSLDRRFLREFESMRALRLPGVVRVIEAGRDGDMLWFAMDRVVGEPFSVVVQRATSIRERVRLAVRLGYQLADTLADLHRVGIIHRDVKPSNVLVDAEHRVHVLDFGIVRFFGDGEGQHTTQTGEIVGTAAFMAPEQLAGLPIDERVDVFATGILLYEAIAGRRARPRTAIAWIPRTCLERPTPLSSRFVEVPRDFSAVVQRMLAADATQRPSAADVALQLRRHHGRSPPQEWPDAPFVESTSKQDDPFPALLGCVGEADGPAVQVLQGPTGAGRSRLAEQVQREGLLRGVWTVHGRCRVDVVGGPVEAMLDRIVATTSDEPWLETAIGEDADPIRKTWSHLGLPGDAPSGPMPALEAIAGSVAVTLARIAVHRPLLWVLHSLESIDVLTAAVLTRLQRYTGRQLTVLCLHDPRWASERSRATVATLSGEGALIHHVARVGAATASQIASAIAPEAPPTRVPACRAVHAVEAGLAALAQWRGEQYAPPSHRLWPLTLVDAPIPAAVLRHLAGDEAMSDPHLVHADAGVTLASPGAKTSVRARLADRAVAAATLTRVWSAQKSITDESLATLRLLAGDERGAFGAVARAAVSAARLGRYADARRWLLLLSTLPAPDEMSQRAAFGLARVRARVAIRTQVRSPRGDLAEACTRLAHTPAQRLDARLVCAEYGLRSADPKAAIVAALHVAAEARSLAPTVAVRALLVATQGRAAIGKLDEVSNELIKAEDLLRASPDPVLAVQTLSWRGALALHHHQLGEARDLSSEALRQALRFGYVRGHAFAAARLGRVLRMAGHRRESERHVRDALDAFNVTGDVALRAEARLFLATLLAERGDAPAARHLLDQTVRRIRHLRLTRLLAPAMRVALEIATARDDPYDASMAISELEGGGNQDADAAAALVRWWRVRGDMTRALAVTAPPRDGHGAVLFRAERARTHLAVGDPQSALATARDAHDVAQVAGFHELALYAALIMGGTGAPDPDWDRRVASAMESLSIHVYLGALEMDARRKHTQGDLAGARTRWEGLIVRAGDLGYAPALREAEGWLEA